MAEKNAETNRNECYENNCCDLNRIKNIKLKKYMI